MVPEDGAREYGAEGGNQQREVNRDHDPSGYRQDQTEGAERAPQREGDETGQDEQEAGSRENARPPPISPARYSPTPSKAMISAVIHARNNTAAATSIDLAPDTAAVATRLAGVPSTAASRLKGHTLQGRHRRGR